MLQVLYAYPSNLQLEAPPPGGSQVNCAPHAEEYVPSHCKTAQVELSLPHPQPCHLISTHTPRLGRQFLIWVCGLRWGWLGLCGENTTF